MSNTLLPVIHPQPDHIGPLASIRVVDLSRLVAGNMLSLQLADFGADVIKVESPQSGDTLRHWREVHDDYPDGYDGWWRVYGRNKRSLALNLRDDAAMAHLVALIGTAQVLIESFRPGTLEAMGLAPEVLHRRNPKLVIVRVSGWGQSGSQRDLPGFGSLIEGFSGFAHKHQSNGSPQLPNMALADMVAGLTGAFATMIALREVEVNSGRGQVIDLSLLDPMLAIMGPDVTHYAATGRHAPPQTKIASPRGVYRCKDGKWIALSGSTQAMARRVFEAIGEATLFDDPRFATNAARLQHDVIIDKMINGVVQDLDRDACLRLFRSSGVTVGPIYDAHDLIHDDHIATRAAYVAVRHAAGSDEAVPGGAPSTTTVMHNITPTLSDTPGAVRRLAPDLGADTRVILVELDVSQADIDELCEKGAIECR